MDTMDTKQENSFGGARLQKSSVADREKPESFITFNVISARGLQLRFA